MCPDNDTPAPAEQNPTLAEDDKFRRTIEPSVGPNANGYEGAADDAVSSNVKSDIEPSMPAPDAPHVPDVPLEG
jgi:hypothetical protein